MYLKSKSFKINDYEIIGIENDERELETFGRKKDCPDLVFLQSGFPKYKDFNEQSANDLFEMFKKKIDAQEEFLEQFYETNGNAYILNNENTELIS